MLTRCPGCATVFRIGLEQLRARHGKVRCGECSEVFNALDSLVEEALSAPLPSAVMPSTHEGPHHSAAESPTASASHVDSTNPALRVHEAARPDIRTNSAPVGSGIVAEGLEPPVVPTVELPIAELDQTIHDLPADAPTWRRAMWVSALLLALVGLLGQVVVHWRTELAVIWPDSRPLLAVLCDAVGCQLERPMKVEFLSIESSDLHPDPANSEHLVLTATIRNRAPFAQTWPHLELTLTDTADKALTRRVIAPADYLPAVKSPVTTSIDAGIAAGSDVPLELDLATPTMSAAGYRLYVFYP